MLGKFFASLAASGSCRSVCYLCGFVPSECYCTFSGCRSLRDLLKCRDISAVALPIGLPLLALVAWIPHFLSLRAISADQVWENFGIGTACQGGRFQLGWVGPSSELVGMGGFTGSLPARIVSWLSCQLALHSALYPSQAFLIVGLVLTFGLALVACRQIGFRLESSLAVAVVITTAPCSFSRIGHLSLAMIWPVVPGLVACYALWQVMQQRRIRWIGLAQGALAGLLCFPAQDYYLVFLILQLLACFVFGLFWATTRSSDLGTLGRIAGTGMLYVAGFVAVMILAEAPNLLAVSAGGPPMAWVAPRYPSEQFQYGLLPFTWLISPPWHQLVNQALSTSGLATGYESFWMSRGSLLIPIAWFVALWQLGARRPAHSQQEWKRSPIPLLAYLLGLVTFIGLFCMTMGGLGTLFAVFVSPVLRSLNRYTVFVYGASVLFLASMLDASLRRRLPS